jgi:hypothetical protein
LVELLGGPAIDKLGEDIRQIGLRVSLRGHLKAEGNEETGSQSYVPPDEKDDRALTEALDLLPGTIADAAFPPNPKAAVP